MLYWVHDMRPIRFTVLLIKSHPWLISTLVPNKCFIWNDSELTYIRFLCWLIVESLQDCNGLWIFSEPLLLSKYTDKNLSQLQSKCQGYSCSLKNLFLNFEWKKNYITQVQSETDSFSSWKNKVSVFWFQWYVILNDMFCCWLTKIGVN